nr:hypothetical protein [Tanacetum cinerariifolium]
RLADIASPDSRRDSPGVPYRFWTIRFCGNPPPVTIHTWLECFNKQKPRSFEKETAPVNAENWISHMEKIFDIMGCEDTFKTRLAVYKFEAFPPTCWVPRSSCWYCGEQAKNFQWGLRKSTLNHLMCIPFTDVAQVANAARNYEILHERDDDGAERGGGDNHRSNNNYSGNNNRSSGNRRDQRNRGQQSNRPVDSGFQQSRGPSEGYSYPVCTTCGRRHPGECRRPAGTCFKCGQTSHLQKDCKKNTAASTSGQADKKPGASGRVFAITEDHVTKTSGTITDTLFIYGHAVFVLFYTGATHSVISSVFASCADKKPGASGRVFAITEEHATKTSGTITDHFHFASTYFIVPWL